MTINVQQYLMRPPRRRRVPLTDAQRAGRRMRGMTLPAVFAARADLFGDLPRAKVRGLIRAAFPWLTATGYRDAAVRAGAEDLA